MPKTYVAIMAGGVGSRFWPSSREAKPKQFLDMLGIGKSLLQLTVERFERLVPLDQIWIVTNERYTEIVLEQLPGIPPGNILAEPSRNNTAPCIAYTAFKLQGIEPDANLIIAPSDHIILKEDNFIHALGEALAFTGSRKAIVTLGIQPSRPDTGYGYIQYDRDSEQGVHAVTRFTEKPDLLTAESFLDSGDYVWNAGIFIWSVPTLIQALAQYAPEIYSVFEAGKDQLNTEQEQSFLGHYYPLCPNISIDYAVLEKADFVYTIPADLGWSDLGTWASLYAESDKDSDENVILQGKIDPEGSSHCIIRLPPHKHAIIKGLQDYIIVDEDDVLLIYPKNQEQEIKQVSSRFPSLQ